MKVNVPSSKAAPGVRPLAGALVDDEHAAAPQRQRRRNATAVRTGRSGTRSVARSVPMALQFGRFDRDSVTLGDVARRRRDASSFGEGCACAARYFGVTFVRV
jgi:hypothetical protein